MILAILEKSTEEVAKINSISIELMKPNIIDSVIQETLKRTGKFTSKYTLTADQALSAGMKFIGESYKEIGKSGDGLFRSLDGLRQFRIDPGSLQGFHRPWRSHIHLEYFKKVMEKPFSNNRIFFVE